MFFGNVLRDASPISGKVCECVCGIYVFTADRNIFKVVSDWLTLAAYLCKTILVGGPLWTQFDNVVVLAVESLVVVFFTLLFLGIGFQRFGNMKDILLI